MDGCRVLPRAFRRYGALRVPKRAIYVNGQRYALKLHLILSGSPIHSISLVAGVRAVVVLTGTDNSRKPPSLICKAATDSLSRLENGYGREYAIVKQAV